MWKFCLLGHILSIIWSCSYKSSTLDTIIKEWLILIQLIDIKKFHENQALGIHCKCTLAEPWEHIMHSIKFEPTTPHQKSYKSKQLYVRKTLNDIILNTRSWARFD